MATYGITDRFPIQMTVSGYVESTNVFPFPSAPLPNTNPKESKPVPIAQQTSKNQSNDAETIPYEMGGIFDYMIWSLINLVIGAFVFGILSIILSLLTRKYKRLGDVRAARVFSRITLAWNIFVSFLALVGGVFLITYYNNPL